MYFLTGGIGFEDTVFNDVWTSRNGSIWSVGTQNARWRRRYDHSCLVFQSKLWILGGITDKDEVLNDVWRTDDDVLPTSSASSAGITGALWSLATIQADWSGRSGFAAAVAGDTM